LLRGRKEAGDGAARDLQIPKSGICRNIEFAGISAVADDRVASDEYPTVLTLGLRGPSGFQKGLGRVKTDIF
jgi:hypothetical protein